VCSVRVDEMAGAQLLEKSKPLELGSVDHGNGDRRHVDVTVNAENEKNCLYTSWFNRYTVAKTEHARKCLSWNLWLLFVTGVFKFLHGVEGIHGVVNNFKGLLNLCFIAFLKNFPSFSSLFSAFKSPTYIFGFVYIF